jgi:hypothetical protein
MRDSFYLKSEICYFWSELKIVTYSLEPGGNKGDQYYQVIDQFADTVLREARSMLGPIIVKFTQFISAQEIEDLRSAEEYYLN